MKMKLFESSKWASIVSKTVSLLTCNLEMPIFSIGYGTDWGSPQLN